MVGRLDRNLRQGHRAELEGIELLRGICAVAQVPQTEDVGFDAVATLLRTDGRFLYAEDSFCVQFKSRSIREIKLTPHEYKWFHALSMPLFIGSVDVESKEVELFTTHRVAGHLNRWNFTSAILCLDPGQDLLQGDCMRLGLGDPVLRWTPQNISAPEFQSRAYTILKQWVTTEYQNIGLRRIRSRIHLSDWKTNEAPDPGCMAAMAGPDELVQDLEAAVPYLLKIATHLLSRDEDKHVPLELLGFYLLSNWIYSQNVPDTKILAQMAGHKLGVHQDGFRLELKMEISKASDENQFR
jgi:hypothetical protein